MDMKRCNCGEFDQSSKYSNFPISTASSLDATLIGNYMRHSFFPPKDSHRPERIGAYEKFYKGRKEPFQIILATEHYSKLFQQYGDNGWSRGSFKIVKISDTLLQSIK